MLWYLFCMPFYVIILHSNVMVNFAVNKEFSRHGTCFETIYLQRNTHKKVEISGSFCPPSRFISQKVVLLCMFVSK